MSRLLQSLLVSGLMIAAPAIAQSAYDPVQARYLAANCANCHGTDGAAREGMKALAGYGKQDFIDAMKGFKSGKKPATIMHQLSKGYDDAQIETLAEFFSRQPKAAAK